MFQIRTRFAPSPTGFMHVGGLRTALYCYLFAKKHQGAFILRIEDTDLERYVDGAVEVIYSTLQAAGIIVDEGPNEGGPYGPYIQTERKDIYLKYAQELVKKGAAYYCFCDKERLELLADSKGIKRYDKHCLHLTNQEVQELLNRGVKYVIRQNMPLDGVSTFDDLVFGNVTIPNYELEDQVLIKSDGLPTYNFANVIDDYLMKISHVIRGNEYLSSTPKYNLLYDAFGWPRPQYIHLSQIMKDATRKLSKRYGDANFDDFIKKGYLPEAIINYIALLGWSPKGEQEKFSLQEMVEKFSLDGLNKANSIFDETKMKWLNGEYIKELSFDQFMKLALPFFEVSDIKGKYDYQKIGRLIQSRVEILSEIPEKINFLVHYQQFSNDLYDNKKFKIDSQVAKNILEHSLIDLKDLSSWTEEKLHESIIRTSEKLKTKSGQVYTVLRVALSGVLITPGGAVEIADILGKSESIRRIEQALKWIGE